MGVDFSMIPGKGPKILRPIQTRSDVLALKPISDVDAQVPFLRPILEVRTVLAIAHPATIWMIDAE